VVLPPQRDRSDRPLHGIGVELDPAILEVPAEGELAPLGRDWWVLDTLDLGHSTDAPSPDRPPLRPP
jgi:hypothetical protein